MIPFISACKRPLAHLRHGRGAHVVAIAFTLSAGHASAAWDAFSKGAFGPVVDWPLISIHAVLLPDGRVLSYGTDGDGRQTAQFIYDVWNPSLGTGQASHLTLPNKTGVDSFCAGQIVLPSKGTVLMTGGDKTIDGARNFANNDVNVFDYRSSSLYSARQPMANRRWYPGIVTTAAGEVVVLGGLSTPDGPVATPEVYTEGRGWRSLTNAASDEAYGVQNWTYPRAWQAPNGKVFIATALGSTYYLDTTGAGQVSKTNLELPQGDPYLTSVMFAPGKILALRQNNQARVIDLNGFTPMASTVPGVGQERYHASATVMADGRVLVSGGSTVANEDTGVAYTAKIWNPGNNGWSTAASASKMRLYHSVSLLLPDGRVLTAGGGAPGPVNNLNAEIYTPPYLYKWDLLSGSKLAVRPVITKAPATATWRETIAVKMDSSSVGKVTLLKTGSATHTVDFDQRFLNLNFTASQTTVSVTMPASANVAPPGCYMLFVFNRAGVPSVAKIIKLE